MCIRARHTFINADWVARTTRRSGNMPKTMASRLSRKTRTFKNEAYCTDTRQKSSGCAQRTARVTRSRVSCERLSRLSLGSFRGTKNPAWSWAPERRPGNSSRLRTFSSKGPATQSYLPRQILQSDASKICKRGPAGLWWRGYKPLRVCGRQPGKRDRSLRYGLHNLQERNGPVALCGSLSYDLWSRGKSGTGSAVATGDHGNMEQESGVREMQGYVPSSGNIGSERDRLAECDF